MLLPVKERGKGIKAIMRRRRRLRLWFRQQGVCVYCRENMLWIDTSFDHVIPISKGGTFKVKNIVLAHSKCNKEKANKIIKPMEVNMDKFKYVVTIGIPAAPVFYATSPYKYSSISKAREAAREYMEMVGKAFIERNIEIKREGAEYVPQVQKAKRSAKVKEAQRYFQPFKSGRIRPTHKRSARQSKGLRNFCS